MSWTKVSVPQLVGAAKGHMVMQLLHLIHFSVCGMIALAKATFLAMTERLPSIPHPG
ncbi:MAG: hypothetical protein DDT18_01906 [Actinobacteria bacterium]|nr:hypothetical protein [Actinomycetota bacterium]